MVILSIVAAQFHKARGMRRKEMSTGNCTSPMIDDYQNPAKQIGII
jgi:hypothetical protein